MWEWVLLCVRSVVPEQFADLAFTKWKCLQHMPLWCTMHVSRVSFSPLALRAPVTALYTAPRAARAFLQIYMPLLSRSADYVRILAPNRHWSCAERAPCGRPSKPRINTQKLNSLRMPSHKGASVLPGLVMSETLLGATANGLSVFTRGSWSAFWWPRLSTGLWSESDSGANM